MKEFAMNTNVMPDDEYVNPSDGDDEGYDGYEEDSFLPESLLKAGRRTKDAEKTAPKKKMKKKFHQEARTRYLRKHRDDIEW